MICSEKANSFSQHACMYTDTYTYINIFSWSFIFLFQQQKPLKTIPSTNSYIGPSLSHLPMQAVWCWVNPGGHLHVKLPMVLTHRNWQLCCLVAHSSRSIRKCKMGIGIELKPRNLEATLGSSSVFSFLPLK